MFAETAGLVSGFSHCFRLLIQTWSLTSRGLLTEDRAWQTQPRIALPANSIVSLAAGNDTKEKTRGRSLFLTCRFLSPCFGAFWCDLCTYFSGTSDSNVLELVISHWEITDVRSQSKLSSQELRRPKVLRLGHVWSLGKTCLGKKTWDITVCVDCLTSRCGQMKVENLETFDDAAHIWTPL